MRKATVRNPLLASVIATIMLITCVACGESYDEPYKTPQKSEYTVAEAIEEINLLNNSINPSILAPKLDMTYSASDSSVANALSDIDDAYPIVVKGNGAINIEVAASTELSTSGGSDDLLLKIAEKFNKSGATIDGKSVSVSIRRMPSGEVLTYSVYGNYKPQLFIPSNEAWGKMIEASGVEVKEVSGRLFGDVAGVLLSQQDSEILKKNGDLDLKNIIETANKGDIVFGYTNPYTSSTGLNIFSQMLLAFDEDPLSNTAKTKLIEYQKNAPIAALTTTNLKKAAANGTISSMVMEYQAYSNTPEVKSYVFIPQGIRHDHPAFEFKNTPEQSKAVSAFVEYCLNDESQALAKQRGFNQKDDYKYTGPVLSGNDYLSIQQVWKQNKSGGKDIVSVFVADVSGSMGRYSRMTNLKKSLKATMQFLRNDGYVGIVSYDENVYINLPIEQFNPQQQAYFSGAIDSLSPGSETATYNAAIVAAKMLLEKQEEIGNECDLKMYLLTDGDRNCGISVDRAVKLLAPLKISVYSLGYSAGSNAEGDLKKISNINESGSYESVDPDNIENSVRNLFNVLS